MSRSAAVSAVAGLVLAAACASRPAEEDAAAGEGTAEIPVRIEGIAAVPERDLRAAARRELRAFQRKPSLADAADAAYSMELLLREKGHAHGTVAFERTADALVFRVDEGPRVLLAGVRFRGVESFDEEQLRPFFDFPGSGSFGSGLPLFRRGEVQAAAEELERFYLLEGHLRVRVEDIEVEWSGDRMLATVTVPVEEGRRYEVADVRYEGVAPPRDVDLIGRPYYVRLPVEEAARLRARLLDEGRQFSEVDAAADVDHEAALVVITFTARPGPPVRLAGVRFEGNERTREWFLRRRIPIRDLEIVLQDLYDKGIDNLYRTGLFGSVRPKLARVGDDLAELEIGLDELQAKRVDFEVGYGSYELARGAVRYRDDNIFGTGRRFVTELRGSLRSWGVDMRVEDPWLLGERRTLEVATGYLVREEPSFDLQSIKFDVILTQRLGEHYRLRGGYRLRIEEASNAAAVEEQGFIRTAGLFVGVRRDYRDSPLLPTEGSVADVNVLWSVPALGAELDFIELDLGYAKYLRLSERAVFAVGAHFTAREILDGRATLPIQERLFLGGESTVRSFFESELGPEDVDGDPAGGLTAMWGSVELRYRVWRSLHAAAFYDVGIVGVDAFSTQGPPGHAAGLGLRYYFPVGPLRLDFGWNPGRRFAADQAWALHLAFGFSF